MPKVVAFLEALAASGQVAEAARAVGMSRQSAYRLRARLGAAAFGEAGFAAAFEGARQQGLRARAAASRGRAPSPWEGPGLAEMIALMGARHTARNAARTAERNAGQGDVAARDGDAGPAEGDACGAQGDAGPHKASELRLDCVTGVTAGSRPHAGSRASPAPGKAAMAAPARPPARPPVRPSVRPFA